MRDVNAYMAETLAAMELPMSEEPMRAQCAGSYLTWRVTEDERLFASGRALYRRVRLELSLWAHPEQDADALTQQALTLLREVGCLARFQGMRWQAEVNRMQVHLGCALPLEALP